MIFLGLLLVAVAIAAVTGVAVSSPASAPVHVFGQDAQSHEVGVIFVAGAIAGLVFALGWSMALGAFGRRRARRREARQAERARQAEQRALRDRNAQLERTLAQAPNPPANTPTVVSRPVSVDLTATEQAYAERGPAR